MEVSAGASYGLVDSADRSVLTVLNVESTTPHLYTCTVAWDDYKFKVNAEITPYGFEVGDVIGLKGKDAVLPCKFESSTFSLASVKLAKNVNSIWVDVAGTQFSTSGDVTSANLDLTSIDAGDEADYRCVVTDGDGVTITSESFDFSVVGEFSFFNLHLLFLLMVNIC